MKQYLEFLQHILDNGQMKHDRTGVGTISTFAYQMRFDLQQGFPLVTTKKIHTKSIIAELLWFLQGDTNVQFLHEHGVSIWDEWADEDGDLGPIYGRQWRSWPQPNSPQTVDQIQNLLEQIQQNPNSRRHIVSAWNVGELDQMQLPPCHILFQFYVSSDNRLSCQLYQRSADAFLGVPFNIASYSLLTHMIAQQCHLDVGEFIWTGGDCHIYQNHQEQVLRQLSREPFPSPQLMIQRHPDSIFDYERHDFHFDNYQCHPGIKAPVAV